MLTIKPLKVSRTSILFLYLLYYAQGSLYPTGSLISQTSLFLIFGISLLYFFKTLLLKNKQHSFYYGWTALFVLNVLGYFLSADYDNNSAYNMFKSILAALLGFFPFYYFAIKKELKPKHFAWFAIALVPVTILQFFTNRANFISEYDTENVVNNIAYAFVFLIPFLFLIRNKKLALGLMAIIIFFIIQGAKRGALISGGIGLLIYIYYLLKTLNFRSQIKRLRIYFALSIGLYVVGYFAYRNFLQNEFLIKRLDNMAQGQSSYRIENYKEIFEFWYSSESFFHLFFGFGFASSLEITGRHFAHNDWLELLSNFGLFGVIIYFFLFLAAIKYLINKEYSFQNRLMLLCILSIWFFMTLISMWYTALGTFTQAILLGYLFAEHQRSKDVSLI